MRIFELDVKVSVRDAFADLIEDYELEMNQPIVDMLNTATKVGNECRRFIDQTRPGQVIYRGMHVDGDDAILKKNVRLDARMPADSTDDAHEFVNDYFREHYGAPFRNAMFATGKAYWAASYGQPYIVYPVGEFDFIWSKTIKDLWVVSGSFRKQRMDYRRYERNVALGNEITANQATAPDLWAKAQEQYEKLVLSQYQLTDLSKAIESGHEIMIRSKSYYAISFARLAKEYDKFETMKPMAVYQVQEKMEVIFDEIIRDMI